MLIKQIGTRTDILDKHQRLMTILEKSKAIIDELMLTESSDDAAYKKMVDSGVFDKQVLAMVTFLNFIDDITERARLGGDKTEIEGLGYFFKAFHHAVRYHEDDFRVCLRSFVIAMRARDAASKPRVQEHQKKGDEQEP